MSSHLLVAHCIGHNFMHFHADWLLMQLRQKEISFHIWIAIEMKQSWYEAVGIKIFYHLVPNKLMMLVCLFSGIFMLLMFLVIWLQLGDSSVLLPFTLIEQLNIFICFHKIINTRKMTASYKGRWQPDRHGLLISFVMMS